MAGRAASASGARRGRALATKARGIAKRPAPIGRSRSAAAATAGPARGLASIAEANKSWVETRSDLKDTARKAIVYELLQNSNMVAESLVPWFTENMPATYFRQVRLREGRGRARGGVTLCPALAAMVGSFARWPLPWPSSASRPSPCHADDGDGGGGGGGWVAATGGQ